MCQNYTYAPASGLSENVGGGKIFVTVNNNIVLCNMIWKKGQSAELLIWYLISFESYGLVNTIKVMSSLEYTDQPAYPGNLICAFSVVIYTVNVQKILTL